MPRSRTQSAAAAAQPAALLGWMEALSDPTRLRLLRLLERHELGVVELCDVVQLPQSTVSRHLKVLLDRGWVKHRRHGTTRLYRMILDELDPPTRKLWLLAREQTESWATVQQDQLRLTRRLTQRQRDSREFFAGTAGRWDKLRRELYGDRFTIDAMLALIPSTYTVADLGCGTGHLAAQLAPRVARVIAVDNSPAMLKAARKRTADLPNVDLRAGDLESLPIESATCDAAMLILVLTYSADPVAVLRELSRILKPGGRAVIVDLLRHDRDDFRRQMQQQHPGFDPTELESMLRDAGLNAAQHVAQPPSNYSNVRTNIGIEPIPYVSVRPLPPEPDAKGPALFVATGTRA